MESGNSAALEVPVQSLRHWSSCLIDHLAENAQNGIVLLPHDYYWAIGTDEIHNPYETPQDLTLGQLSFDVTELDLMANGASPTISYGLVWLGAVMTAIGMNEVG